MPAAPIDLIIMPSQYWADPRLTAEPERRLMLAILEEAVNTYARNAHRPGGRAMRLTREARLWFDSRRTDWPFAFQSICDTLGLEPSVIREAVQRTVAAAAPDHKVQQRAA
jgi:hypothetical protein